MADPIDTKLYDKRTAARLMRTGALDPKDWERHLKSLPDLEHNALPIESDLERDLDDAEMAEADDEIEEPVQSV
jgi:hypothetical protein